MYRKIKGGRERKNIERPHNSVKIAMVQLFRSRGGCFVLVWWRDVSLNRNLAGFVEALRLNDQRPGIFQQVVAEHSMVKATCT